MIAETSFRGQHLGWQAMTLMLLYGIEYLKIDGYEVKIKLENQNSISMFEKLKFPAIHACIPSLTHIVLAYNMGL